MPQNQKCCCSCCTALQFAGKFGGLQALTAVFTWYPICICIKKYISSSVTAYPQIACGAATFLHLCHGEGGRHRQLRGKGKKGGLFCAVWSVLECGRVGASESKYIDTMESQDNFRNLSIIAGTYL